MSVFDRVLDSAIDWREQIGSGLEFAGRGLDSAIGVISPSAALSRRQSRATLARYEGAVPNRNRRTFYPETSGDAETQRDAATLRSIARDLERNHDLARGALGILVRNIVGSKGIGIEPQPRTMSGDIDHDLADTLNSLFRDWMRRPEVTHEKGWASCQRLMARTWLRDGEALGQMLAGNIASLDHGSRVPFSLELMEADVLPFHYDNPARGIKQGIERNTWGRKRAFWIHKGHPGDTYRTLESLYPELKRVPAERMLHPYMTDRLSQSRGVSVFASVISRLHDIKDYEESERVAAKVAASMAAYIRKGTPELYGEDPSKLPDEQRHMKFRPGMIFDDLAPGEDIGTIDAKRPNPNAADFRRGQLQAASRGIEAGYSSMSGSYDGSYSAQRQELVEQWEAYAVLADEFISQFIRPVWETFVKAAVASGQVQVPRHVDPLHIANADFRPPAMPWIDPVKEATAMRILKDENIKSLPQIIRERGGDYRDTLRQQRDARRLAKTYDIPFDGNQAANDEPDDNDEDDDANQSQA